MPHWPNDWKKTVTKNSSPTSNKRMQTTIRNINSDRQRYRFRDEASFVFKTPRGLNEQVVREIVQRHHEPDWMLEKRLRALKIFGAKKMPDWGADLSGINFDDITYYWQPTDKAQDSWSRVPKKIKRTFERLGVPLLVDRPAGRRSAGRPCSCW